MKEFIKKLDKEYGALIGLALAFGFFVFIIFMISLVQCYFEARTYNKFKSADSPEATVIDAFFSELRVEAK